MQTAGSISSSDLIGLAQVIVAFIALIVAPEVVRNATERLRSKIIVECTPFGRRSRLNLSTWIVIVKNRTKAFDKIFLSIFSETQGNVVTSYRIRTDHDGGLAFRAGLDGGSLNILFSKYHQSRRMVIVVKFLFPDVPAFNCTTSRIQRKLPNYENLMKGIGRELEIIRDRITLLICYLLA
jgi:hypothetical protein